VAPVHGVATIPQAPGELLLHRDGFIARGHRVAAPIQPGAKVFSMLPHITGGSVAILVLTKALFRRHNALADVERGIPGVASRTHRVIQFDHIDVIAASGSA
jgi:predicted oxidoreductase